MMMMMMMMIYLFTNPSARPRCNTRSILTGLNSEFSFSQTGCLTKAKEPSLPYYLPIVVERRIGFMPFLRVSILVVSEMLSAFPGFELVSSC